ncbi:hypothetical protein QVH35_06495 [Candidatus Nitrosotenuis chungbukensis]|uniref:hypothetical protein n=1 Tax=Candidatus Nitrosotenuis chungbukensis TaxID=1353246 RepID=UPI002673CC9A|nr:hypothetical protein [Candidatus Nitrosotenuis chungbukensis]WKT57104.1 hypothetical protein QVH35_06495 [Candidatus Nitrosotenuis chungbukensis]
MKKRGIIVSLAGIAMLTVSFSIAISILESSGMTGDEFLLPDVLKDAFDQVSEKTQIQPGDTAYFSFDASGDARMLMWGFQVIDPQMDESLAISISNIYGDDFGKFTTSQPVFFETLEITRSDVYNFNVENKGGNPVTLVMMFAENPDDSESVINPNSPLGKSLLPLASFWDFLHCGYIDHHSWNNNNYN